MTKFSVHKIDDSPESSTYVGRYSSEGVDWTRRLSPSNFSLWLVVARLAAKGTLRWPSSHGDEALFVLEGRIEIDGKICPTGGAAIIESDAEATVTALAPVELAHFGPADPSPPTGGLFGPPDTEGHGIHVFGPGGVMKSTATGGLEARWFADSTCPTCRAALLTVSCETARDGRPHSHSQDEIVLMLRGSMRLGAIEVGVGSSVCMPAGVRYAVRGGAQGHCFVNFRRDVSEQLFERHGTPMRETAAETGGVLVGQAL